MHTNAQSTCHADSITHLRHALAHLIKHKPIYSLVPVITYKLIHSLAHIITHNPIT
jgi:hypothetical protein